MARELIILPRFKRDYKKVRRHPEFDAETLEFVFDLLIAGKPLPEEFVEHRLRKGNAWAWDFDVTSGNVGNRRKFIDLSSVNGICDGATVDAKAAIG